MAGGPANMETVDEVAMPANSSSANNASRRRQREGDGPPRKRPRYVAQACESCKRQKVRCNGQKPCNRCAKIRPRECFYHGRSPNPASAFRNEVLAEETRRDISAPDDPASADLS